LSDVGEGLGVVVMVAVGLGDGVTVAVLEGLGEGVVVGVPDGVGVGVELMLAVGVGEAVAVPLAVGDGDGLAVMVVVGVGDGVAVVVLLGVGEGLAEGVEVASKPLLARHPRCTGPFPGPHAPSTTGHAPHGKETSWLVSFNGHFVGQHWSKGRGGGHPMPNMAQAACKVHTRAAQ
jgi:hypothetical protein